MMHPSLDSWRRACRLMQKENKRFTMYLQWYPFSNLSQEDWKTLKTERFYSTYIQDGSFILVDSMRYVTNGYLQKQGATFRPSVIVAPVLFLYLLAFGLEYARVFSDTRKGGICLYSGNLEKGQTHYRESYQKYIRERDALAGKYAHCIKTDITGFYQSINVDALLSEMQALSKNEFSSTDSLFIRGLLLYCGKGGFPTIQNHPTLSFLATRVYLNDIDNDLWKLLKEIKPIHSFDLIRYVDDLYIFFNLQDEDDLFAASNTIINAYADLLRDKGLSLKQEKLKVLTQIEVSASASTISAVDIAAEQIDKGIEIKDSAISELFTSIRKSIDDGSYTQDKLLSFIEEQFAQTVHPIPAIALFRHFLYKESELFQREDVISSIGALLEKGNIGFTFNTRELTLCLLHTRDEKLIKKMLNDLFLSKRRGLWSSVDFVIALTYLQERSMRHVDLMKAIKQNDPRLARYCSSYCKKKFLPEVISSEEENLINLLQNDMPAKIQYVNYLQNDCINNSLEKGAYFKSFFDRAAHHINKIERRVQNNWPYRKNELRSIFKEIEESKEILNEAAKLRRENPLIHASSEIIKESTYQDDIDENVNGLSSILKKKLSKLKQKHTT